ncbi:protein indeterminate-domain 5, chloroplastic [Artemisia annua]|uniref:Protein indeterminate-domain 5, chloroplastic n=1 Tax=Artemisia annua TaxID=35608 RepID=A0A2U1NSN9_ARTAN|nr:protein indeterminate-domain 5, chloroplastic [Artemisia annua]
MLADADDVEVIALSPTTLTAKNRFVCEVCFKGFPREQNLQLHKRGHNLPWQLKQKSLKDEVKRKVYLCPVPSCVHHDPSNALGDLTGIKKHYSRKHGEKKYKCKKCMKMYAVDSDLKAHLKTCSTKEYKCHCGTFFSRRDRFISHRAFCEALGQVKYSQTSSAMGSSSKSTINRNNPSLSVPVTHSGSQISSIQILTSNSPGITHGERDRFISHRAFCEALGQVKYSQTSSAMGSSSKSTINRNNPSLSVPVTHSGSQISSIQILTSNSPGITHGESWLNQISLNSLMNRPSIDINCYKPSQAFVTVPTQQENKHKNQGNVSTKFFTNLLTNTTTPCYKNNFSLTGNVKNYENGEGPSLFSSGGSVSDHPAPIYLSRSHTAVMPQRSATALLQKAGMIGSTSSNTSATNFSRGYASSSLSSPIGGTTFESAKIPVGSKSYDNMDELLNSFSSNGNGSSIFTQYAGATYEKVASYQDQSQNIGSKISLQQSRGVTVTRDFLGVGDAIVGDLSSDGPQSGPVGWSFL